MMDNVMATMSLSMMLYNNNVASVVCGSRYACITCDHSNNCPQNEQLANHRFLLFERTHMAAEFNVDDIIRCYIEMERAWER